MWEQWKSHRNAPKKKRKKGCGFFPSADPPKKGQGEKLGYRETRKKGKVDPQQHMGKRD